MPKSPSGKQELIELVEGSIDDIGEKIYNEIFTEKSKKSFCKLILKGLAEQDIKGIGAASSSDIDDDLRESYSVTVSFQPGEKKTAVEAIVKLNINYELVRRSIADNQEPESTT